MKKFSTSNLKSYSGYIVLGVALFLLYKLGFFKKSNTGSGFLGGLLGEDYSSPLDPLEKDLQRYKNIGIVPSYNDSYYSSFADAIEMENKSLNTNEQAIYDLFRELRNEPDLIKLKIAFGTRRPNMETSSYGLSGFLRADLNESEMIEVNKILKSKALTTL